MLDTFRKVEKDSLEFYFPGDDYGRPEFSGFVKFGSLPLECC